jgi:hypothetical protein
MVPMAWRRVLAVAATMVAGAGCGGESLGGPAPLGTGGGAVLATGGSFGTGTGGTVGIGGAGPTCGLVASFSRVAPVNPDILILMDRSSSLLDDSDGSSCTGGCGASSKWALLTAAVDEMILYNDSVNWGLMFFGADDACGTNPSPNVPISTSAAAAMMIDGALASTTPGGDAPTAAALSAAAAYLGALEDPSPKYVFLVTDGRSGCSSDPQTADVSAENQVATLQALGFPTFVLASVAPSDTAAIAALNRMALNGAQPKIGGANAFYTTTDDLDELLSPIASAVGGCTLPIPGPLDSSLMLAVSATLPDGSQILIPHDSTNGWVLAEPSETSVTLNGTSCEDLESGGYTEVSVAYQCDMAGDLGHSRPVARSPISTSPSATR